MNRIINKFYDFLNTNKQWLGFFLAIVGTLLFSLKSIFIKFLYQDGLDADSVLVLRMAFALPLYLVILIWAFKKNTAPITSSPRLYLKIFFLGFLGYYLASLLDLMGLELISAQLERLSLYTYPFFIALIGFIAFREAITKRLIIALLFSYIGLWLVMGQELQLTGNNVTRGVGLVLASALSFAFYVLLSKPLIKQLGSILFTSLAMISSSVFGIFHGIVIVDWSVLIFSNSAWLWLGLLVVFSTVLPSFMMAEAINRIGPAQTGVVGMLGPIFTIVLAVYFLSEPFTWLIAVGIGLVLFGVMTLVTKKGG